MQFWQILGDLHPRLVQFPLVLLLAGLLFDAAGLISRQDKCHFAGKVLSAAGTFFLLVAFICGIYAEVWAGRAGIPIEQIEWHELMANIASWGFVVLMAWRLFLDGRKRRSLIAYTAIGLAWYSLLVVTGYFGGKLVFEYGAAVVGARANNVLSLHDLNTLATRQTAENLRYSELMHHVAGWLTLALSASLFAHAISPKKADKLKWVGPAILFAGGICLFFFADLDLYRLTDLRQLRDREVQLHKTLSIVLATVGAIGLWRMRKKTAPPGAENHEETPAAKGHLSTPSRVVAVMALIGGGMLFTHVHTVAPYANVAAGVYIAHICMGLTALGIGAARLLQDALPRYQRVFAVIFAGLMCLESGMLITYNEGLPWYIGYGRYERFASLPNGTIAPYGAVRAELTFDPKTQRLDLYVKQRFNDTPVPIAASTVNVMIARGYSETGVALAADGQAFPASHFSAPAPFLKDAMMFSARAQLPIDSEMKWGYFDPWVTNLITPVPPNEVAKYQCPMHDGIISVSPGVCPLCGMPLMPIRLTPPTHLHEADYDMRLETGSPAVVAGRPTVLRFTPTYRGRIFRNLMVVHEHLLHLIIVSSDLTFFDHVHPVMQPDGSLELPYTFAPPGNYLLYADITPTGERSQVFRLPVLVRSGEGETELMEEAGSLTPSPALAKPLAADPTMTAQLIFQPRTPTAGLETHFLFRLTKDGLPVNDLQPYIGAMGHCVIISQDTETYLHCHPEQLFTPGSDTRGGPDIPFATIFPKPGMYKIWGQFNRGGKMVIADFVVEVQGTWLPPKVIRFLLDD